MIIENQAQGDEVAHKIEIYCQVCGKDVDNNELAIRACNDCGADLSEPEQHVAVVVTSLPIFAISF